jgi:glycosyltransferase involved in cell wall biosynthesis
MRTLFVTRAVPHPPTIGSAQRTALLIEALRRLGSVDLFVIGYDNMKAYLDANGYHVAGTGLRSWEMQSRWFRMLRKLLGGRAEMVWRLLRGPKIDYEADPQLQSNVLDVIRRGRYDMVIGRYLAASAQAGLFELRDVPVVVDIDDADTNVQLARIASPATSWWQARLLALRLPLVEQWQRRLWPKASMVWLSNAGDVKLAPHQQHALVPNIPYDMPQRNSLSPSAPASRVVLWVGSFEHRVNLDGVDLFMQSVWPQVLRRDPSLVFRIIGGGLPEKKRQEWMRVPHVEVIGFAPSLRTHYEECALSVVPLLDGAGTKIKVLESLAHLRTCVSTAHSIRGYERFLRDGESLRVADTLDGLVDPIVELANTPPLRHRLEQAGREIVESACARETLYQNVAQAMHALQRHNQPAAA